MENLNQQQCGYCMKNTNCLLMDTYHNFIDQIQQASNPNTKAFLPFVHCTEIEFKRVPEGVNLFETKANN